jgi:hypothetical protein
MFDNSGYSIALFITFLIFLFAKLSPSSSSSWTELALLSLLYQPATSHPPATHPE